MPSNFILTLDTTAPVVTFGSWSGQKGGTTPLIVNYTINEPGVISATLVDQDGTRWSMAVEPTRFTRPLSSTVATGPATIEVVTRDSVNNEAIHTLPVSIVDAYGFRYRTQKKYPVALGTFSDVTPPVEMATARIKTSSKQKHLVRLHTEAVD